MKIDCYLSKKCSSGNALQRNMEQALALEAVSAQVTFYRIGEREAEELGLKGSPSVLIDGRDIQPLDMQGFS